MPTYTVKYSNINLSKKQKNSIANDITNTHSKFTGANTFFGKTASLLQDTMETVR